MDNNHQRPSATIYQFPVRPRMASGSARHAYEPAHAEAQFAAVEFGAGWYHEAALEHAEEDRKGTYRKH